MHEKSPLDRAVKSQVLLETLQLLPVIQESSEAFPLMDKAAKDRAKNGVAGSIMFKIDIVNFEALERCLKLIERMYYRCGGLRKGFAPLTLKKVGSPRVDINREA